MSDDRDRASAILRAAGVPLGHASGSARPSAPEIRRALDEALEAGLEGVERDAVVAWLGALRRHWPSLFAEVASSRARALLAAPRDGDRYLKLRRIALANLSAAHR